MSPKSATDYLLFDIMFHIISVWQVPIETKINKYMKVKLNDFVK